VRQSSTRKARSDTPEYAEVKHGMVDAAIELIAEKGLRKFRFEELAEKIGYNRATIYRYFDSKHDLVTEVMMALMHQITNDIIEETAGTEKVTTQTFTDSLHKLITSLRTDPRYAIIMDAQNVESFARLTHEYFSAITTDMLEKYLMDAPAGRVLKEGMAMDDAVHWLMHQIISYGFFGLKGEDEEQQKAYLEKMVVSVIV
jgi:AcrR family transcriptional regulator